MITYIVNEGKKTVVAKFVVDNGNYNSSGKSDYDIWKYCLCSEFEHIGYACYFGCNIRECIVSKILEPLALEPNYFVGIAKVKGDDVFSEETGKQVAKAKLLAKYYRTEKRIAEKLKEYILKNDIAFLDNRIDSSISRVYAFKGFLKKTDFN